MKFSSLLTLAIAATLVSCGKRETTVVENSDSAAQPPPAAEETPAAAPDPSATASNAAETKPAGNTALSNEDAAQLEAWWKKYNLDPNNPSDLVKDSDGDGYSNREEFLAETNPRDPNSLPGVMEGVSMKSMNEVQVPIILREVLKGGEKARIQHTDGTEEVLATGSNPKGTAYRVKAMKSLVKADKHGVFTDMSQVTLENPDTKETVFLVRDLPARSSETHAVITGPDGREQKIRFEEEFTLAAFPGRKFTVIDLRNDQVVVQEVGAKNVLTIPKR